MVMTLTHLPQDLLILVCIRLPVEDVLVLIQTCRVMHALGSLDYLWRRLLSHWDLPLDIPPNVSLSSLQSNSLRAAAVQALKLDARWRHPRLEISHAQRIISQNSSFVDGMCLLPGARWLVTLQYEQTVKKTHVTLWSTSIVDDHHPIFRKTVAGRVRYLHAHHHRELEQIMIGIAFASHTGEFIRVYNVFLHGGPVTNYTLMFEAKPDELYSMGRIAGMKINGEIMLVVIASLQENQGTILCVNLATRATVVLECPDWLFAWSHLKVFRRFFVVVTLQTLISHGFVRLSFYELPSVILDPRDRLPPFAPCWPERRVIKGSVISSTSWCSDCSLVWELSDDLPMDNTETCSFTIVGHRSLTPRMDTKPSSLHLFHVSFHGGIINCAPAVVPSRTVPSAGEVRVSSSGRRAVLLSSDPATEECTLVKFSFEREFGNKSRSCISTLMPPFSGLPFNPRDFHSFVFDEISCKMAVSLPSGELYILHY